MTRITSLPCKVGSIEKSQGDGVAYHGLCCGDMGVIEVGFLDSMHGDSEGRSVIYTFALANGRVARHIMWVSDGDRMNKPWMKQWKDEAVPELFCAQCQASLFPL